MKANDISGLGMVSGSEGNIVENQNNETRCGITFERPWSRLEASKFECKHIHTQMWEDDQDIYAIEGEPPWLRMGKEWKLSQQDK